MTAKRAVIALLVFVLFAFSVVYGVMAAIAPVPAPPEVKPGPPLGSRLAERVLLVIVDGLRYDIATDPAIMPHFSASMKRHTSAEMWAGRVSMTTSAVLGLGTGQRGRLEQIIRNVGAKPAPYNSWLANARERGLRLATAGDPAWIELYSKELWKYRRDPEGVAIDVDFNPKTFADTRELIALRPDFLVAHFVTPDHQGHAYGIQSERYRTHMRDFDQKLGAFLDELDRSYTVIVTSDHGAADSGTHGTDVAIQRRCPVYAYGQGIREGVQLQKPLDQLDLAVTLAALLGVPPAAHGTGHVLVDWLDLPDAERTRVACQNARRVLRYTNSLGIALPSSDILSEECENAAVMSRGQALAEQKVRAADDAVSHRTGLTSNASVTSLLLIALLGLCVLWILVPGLEGRAVLSGMSLISVTVWLVLIVERLPGSLPNAVRVLLFFLGNVALLWLVLRPTQFSKWLERNLPYSLVLAPGALAVSYPADARPESFVVVAMLMVLGFRQWNPEPSSDASSTAQGGALASGSALSLKHAIVLAVSLAMLLPTMIRENAVYSGLLTDERARRVLVSLFTACLIIAFGNELRLKRAPLLLLLVLGLTPIWLRTALGPWFGKGIWLICGYLFLFEFVAGHRNRALIFGVLSVLWLSRDFEAAPLLAALGAARIIGPRLLAAAAYRPAFIRPLAALYGFALLFCLRVGIQDGLEFTGMDWGAGAFNDGNVSPYLVGAALVYKYAASAMLLGICLSSGTSDSTQAAVFFGILLCLVVRVVSLSGMFFVAGSSYWTALRIIGDLPTVVAMGFGCMLGFVGSVSRSSRLQRQPLPLEAL